MEDKRIMVCPICGKEVSRSDMIFSHDCHGIPFRLICYPCYAMIKSWKKKATMANTIRKPTSVSTGIIRRYQRWLK